MGYDAAKIVLNLLKVDIMSHIFDQKPVPSQSMSTKVPYNMVRSILAFACALMVTLLASCSDGDEVLPMPAGLPRQQLKQTVIVYMAGENTLASFTASDSLEIAAALPMIDDSSRVVVYIDDARSSRICAGTNTTPLQTVYTFPDNVCSTDSTQMDAVLSHIFTTYPAEHYVMVLWSHASGWVFQHAAAKVRRNSFGIDNSRRSSLNSGLQMDIPTLAGVLSHHPHLDYIFFDACFMQCVEVAYELRHVADYVAGSPAEIPGDGAPYDLMIPQMARPDASAEEQLQDALNAYSAYYGSGPGYKTYHGVELSAIRTAMLPQLAEATRQHVTTLFGERTTANTTDVQRYCPSANSTTYTEFFDMQHTMYTLLPESDYDSWEQAYEQAVPIKVLTPQWYTALVGFDGKFCSIIDEAHTGAVSMFVPNDVYAARRWTDSYKQLQWAIDTDFDSTGW